MHEGFICEVKRHPSLCHLCGYIQVPPNHPWFGKEYVNVEVHGGITWSSKSEITQNWVLGFDCSHAGDIAWPSLMFGSIMDMDEEYRDWDYVKSQVNYLASKARKVYPVDDDVNSIVNFAKIKLVTLVKSPEYNKLPTFKRK
jgi:hypothetical protein